MTLFEMEKSLKRLLTQNFVRNDNSLLKTGKTFLKIYLNFVYVFQDRHRSVSNKQKLFRMVFSNVSISCFCYAIGAKLTFYSSMLENHFCIISLEFLRRPAYFF